MSDLLTYCRDHTDEMITMLKAMIEYETFTSEKAAVDRFGAYTADMLARMGAAVERYPNDIVGDMYLAKFNPDAPGKPITFLVHLDTVWPLGTLAKRPVRIEEGRLYGPGAIDMKPGIAVTIQSIKVLQDQGELPNRPIWVLVTSDEECGSTHSEGLIRKVALESGLILVMEPATPEGAVKTWRKGIANYKVKALGRASHAGGAPEQGINAVVEIAHQVLAISKLNDLRNGTSVSVTMINGGHATNVIPAHAEIMVDVRFLTMSAGENVDAAMNALQSMVPGTQLVLEGGISRPPMERNETAQWAFQQLKQIGENTGVEVIEAGSGGGSDGNFTAALGIPTLDGMGPTGEGLHAEHENVLISSIPDKVALIAALLQQWVMQR